MPERAQSAIEFLTTYGLAILIVVIAIGAISLYVIPKSITPQSCNIYGQLNCIDILYFNTSTNSILVISASDSQPGVLNISHFSASIAGVNDSGACVPSQISEGQTTYCAVIFSTKFSHAQVYSGTETIQANYCASASNSASCNANSNYIFSGTFSTQGSPASIINTEASGLLSVLAALNVTSESLQGQASSTTSTTTITQANIITTFTESGLPSSPVAILGGGTLPFTVTYNSITNSSGSQTFVLFSTQPGNYPYTVPNVTYVPSYILLTPPAQGYKQFSTIYSPSSSTGVAHAGSNTNVIFTSTAASSSFVETGLPKNALFQVQFANQIASTTTLFSPPNTVQLNFNAIKYGSYPFTVYNFIASNGTIYAPSPQSGSLSSVPASSVYITYKGTPSNTVPQPLGYAYVIGSGNSIYVINTQTNQLVNTIATSVLGGIAVSPNGNYLYVVTSNTEYGLTDSVNVISTTTYKAVNTIFISAALQLGNITVSPDGQYIYAGDLGANPNCIGDGYYGFYTNPPGIPDCWTFIIISIQTGLRVYQGGLLEAPFHLAVSPNDQALYITSTQAYWPSVPAYHINVTAALESGTLYSNPPPSNVVSEIGSIGASPSGIAVSPNGKYTYITDADPNVYGNPNLYAIKDFYMSDQQENTITISGNPNGIEYVAVTPNGQYAYASSSGIIYIFSTESDKLVNTITLGPNAGGTSDIAFTPNGQYAYLTNRASGTVSVINTQTGQVTSTISGIPGAYQIAIVPPPANSVKTVFTESGLPTNAIFSAQYGAASTNFGPILANISTSSGNTLTFNTLPGVNLYLISNATANNGIYRYLYTASTPNGFLAAGSNTNVQFKQTGLVTKFTETGLPSNAPFYVTYDNVVNTTNTTSLSILTTSPISGNYPYTVTSTFYNGVSYVPATQTGYAIAGLSANVQFVVASQNVSTSFIETGLPQSAIFKVSFNNVVENTIAASYQNYTTLSFITPPGNYQYTIYSYAAANGITYLPSNSLGTLAAGSSLYVNYGCSSNYVYNYYLGLCQPVFTLSSSWNSITSNYIIANLSSITANGIACPMVARNQTYYYNQVAEEIIADCSQATETSPNIFGFYFSNTGNILNVTTGN